jgi:hypothetical protein
MTPSINETRHNNNLPSVDLTTVLLNVIMPSVVMLYVFMLSVMDSLIFSSQDGACISGAPYGAHLKV